MMRNSNFEILRIIAMIGIILQHCVAHNVINYDDIYLHNFLSGLFLQWGMLGRLGVAIFIIIFGYFGIEQKFNTKRLLNLIIQVFSYSVLTFAAISVIDRSYFNRGDLIHALFPISFHKYWFITAYVIFYLFTPFLNNFLKSLKKGDFRCFILIQLIVWSLIPSITLDNVKNYIDEMPQFLMIYCIGAYIRLYSKDFGIRVYRALFATGTLIYLFSPVMFDLLGFRISYFANQGNAFYTRYSLPTLMIAAGLTGICAYKEPRHNAALNYIAGCTFGIYLFHFSIVDFLFEKYLPITNYVSDWRKTALYLIGCTAALFLSGLIIESVRKMIEKAYQPIVIRLSGSLENIWLSRFPSSS